MGQKASKSTPEPEPQIKGDPIKGREVYIRECEHCHTIEKGGPHKFGPNLQNLFNRKAGELKGFKYRDPEKWKERNITWTEKTLDEYMADPRNYVPGTKLFFKPVPSEEDRRNVIAYIKEMAKD